MLDRFVTAFEAKDISAIIELFTKDAVWEMPPFIGWYRRPGRHRRARRATSAPPSGQATCA